MLLRSLLLLLTVVVHAGSAQMTTSTYPPPPDEYPPETGRPKDMGNCRINANTLFPFVVGIWDKATKLYVGHGSMLTYIAFLTSCREYTTPLSYVAVGQFVWNISLPEDPCMQDRNVQSIYRHPQCAKSPKTATFFDFSVMRLVYPFDITGPNYPIMYLSITAYDLFNSIKYYNIKSNATGCALPYFRTQTEQPPIFDSKSSVKAIPFHSKCVDLLCEKIPPNTGFVTMCKKRFEERANGTMLCMTNRDRKPIQLGSGGRYWYAGTPLHCNGTALGIAAQAKIRQGYPALQLDIHFVVTFLRVWPWLIELRRNHSGHWGPQYFLHNSTVVPHRHAHGDAYIPEPSLKILAIMILMVVTSHLLISLL